MIAVRSDLHDHFASVKPIAKMSEALHKLRASGCQLAMVTSNSGENVEQFLCRHGMDDFQSVVSGASIFGKATRLRRLMKTAHADPKTTVYIGDTAPDLQAAREAGTLAVGVTWGFSDKAPLAAEGPDALVEAPEKLPLAVLALLSRQ
jgi:phosphoglycolate phosphatase